ncbi:heavy-metal-associated domain-containing protein [Bacillaceae bacterium SIJ1]|uniref:copper ion binding protein n=1 Tax=Litoribacterium kuwaitense TaxID=1398745 RepID=UPI0013ECCC2B|nr:copper ion binding protein [Litoribacterium kuwaitense]NGP45673.1 heavy-metal-associated domain-containing protein [Litoribacterium kuwaitense]
MQQLINVKGMSCGSCVKKIEGQLGKLNGVESVKVILADEKVDVSFDEKIIQLADIQRAIQDAGYEVVEGPTEKDRSCCQ